MTVMLYAGEIHVVRPYGTAILNSIVIGGLVCVVAGNLVMTGTYIISAGTYSSVGGAAAIMAVFGGTLNLFGGGIIILSGPTSVAGVGKLLTVGKQKQTPSRSEGRGNNR